MKINWGTGIIIAFALFMTFILYFVFKVQCDSQYDHEMVTEEYYKKELDFQSELNKQENANNLTERVSIEPNENGLLIVFPKTFDIAKIKGKISLYRPSNQKLDFEVPISLSTSNLLIPKTDLVGGRWDIAVEWEYGGKEYLNKKEISL